MLRIALVALALAACSGNSTSEKEMSDIRAEIADLRADQRADRQEIRDLREQLKKQADGEPSADADAGAPATASTEPPAGAAPPPAAPPTPAGKPAGKPPAAQGSVNIQVESNPAGASVFVAEKKVGLTPVMIKTPVGSSEISVRLEKAGYRPRLMTLRPEEDTKISVQLAKKGE